MLPTVGALLLAAASAAADPPACSDGADNDGDGLADFPLDPGCASASDSDEGGDPLPALAFRFNTTDGRLLELNATALAQRVVWDETDRFLTPPAAPGAPPRPNTGTHLWMHSESGFAAGGGTHWQIHPQPDSNWSQVVDEVVAGNSRYAGVDPSGATVRVVSETDSLLVEDTFHFSGQTMFVTVNITRQNETSGRWVISVPMILGPLAVGHRFPNGSLDTGNLGMWELSADHGGWNNTWSTPGTPSKYTPGGVLRHSPTGCAYPSGAFSPVSVMADSRIAVGVAAVSTIDASTTVALQQSVPMTRYNPAFRGTLETALVNRSTVLTFAVTVAPAGEWQSTLALYRTFFEATYGGVTYCPSGPFLVNAYESGRRGQGGPNRLPPMSLFNISKPPDAAPKMKGYGMSLFGVWGTALDSSFETMDGKANEFNPVTEFLDPNIAEHDLAVMATFLKSFSDQGIDVFWFQRPCSDIVDVECKKASCTEASDWTVRKVVVEYTESAPGFNVVQKGNFTWSHDMLQWPPNHIDAQLERMEFWLNRSVKGFYFDEANCGNLDEFLRRARSRWPDVFTVVEGSTDRLCVLSPSIPIVKENEWFSNNSILITWLLPDATFYSGGIDQGLDANETLAQMLKGVGTAIPPSVLEGELADPWCEILDQSYANQMRKWTAAPKSLQCPEPLKRTLSCKSPGAAGQA